MFWRPQGDSNPRRRRERAVSWARLDDRDLKLKPLREMTPQVVLCNGEPDWDRTSDHLIKSQMLYLLSYRPVTTESFYT